jgi:D-arginine dehydrogenase
LRFAGKDTSAVQKAVPPKDGKCEYPQKRGDFVMDCRAFDVIVIGAGMAGASVAAALSTTHKVALIEAEEQPGYHTTARSAAMWVLNYGPSDVRTLTGLSKPFFQNPPDGFGTLSRSRPVLYLAPKTMVGALDELIQLGLGVREISLAQAIQTVPAIKRGYAARAGLEEDAFDMDVAALHQGYLRALLRGGGTLALRSRAGRIVREGPLWRVHVATGGLFAAPILVNAAGAWGDEIAAIAGVPPLGLMPCRRTVAIIDPSPYQVEHWPMVQSVVHDWYIRPEARTKLMVTPCDETPTTAHDVRPEEFDIALGIDRMQQALSIAIRRIERSWAGLRTFTPDRSLAFGFERNTEGFFWCVGQGGYGIQTAPAAGALCAAIIRGVDPGPAGKIIPIVNPNRFRA